MAEELAKARGLPGIGRSDSHFYHDPWDIYAEIQASLSVDEVLEAIRKGNVRVSSAAGSIHF
jgi:hypothetical protein